MQPATQLVQLSTQVLSYILHSLNIAALSKRTQLPGVLPQKDHTFPGSLTVFSFMPQRQL